VTRDPNPQSDNEHDDDFVSSSTEKQLADLLIGDVILKIDPVSGQVLRTDRARTEDATPGDPHLSDG
jgi:hypothetical protein